MTNNGGEGTLTLSRLNRRVNIINRGVLIIKWWVGDRAVGLNAPPWMGGHIKSIHQVQPHTPQIYIFCGPMITSSHTPPTIFSGVPPIGGG